MDTLDLGIAVLRFVVGLTFAVHGAQKLFGWWGGPGFAGWQAAMAHMGFRPALAFALISGLIEFGGGLLLVAGLLTPFVASALVAQSVVIIGQVHWSNGFFNSKSGFEFPLLLGAAAAALALVGSGAVSLDAAVNLGVGPLAPAALVLGGLVAGLAILAIPHLGKATTASHA
jgi:putative oxidoreductase